MSIDGFWLAERIYNPEEAYFNERDGLYYCVNCNTPVEAFFPKREKGKHPCMCKCRREEHEQREKERKLREHIAVVEKLRQEAFSGRRMYDWKFENSEVNTKQIEAAKKYVATWTEMEQENQGLLFFGDVGRGKSYTAACVVNAIIEMEVRAKMINLATIINDLQSLVGENRSSYIDKLCRYRLLVFDDLGAERGTEFAREQVYNVINARWESGRPFIVTTNLSLKEMQNEEQMVLKRIYDRVLDVCRPIAFQGENYRANGQKKQLDMVQDLWRDMQ